MGRFETTVITRRTLLKATAAAGALAGAAGCAMPSAPAKLAIIHTNDTHGHDLLDDESLGMAAVAQLRTDYEEQGYEVLVLDAGDAVQGMSLVNHSTGDAAIEFMNATGYHAMAIGNHEFDFGQDKIVDYIAAATFPILSANVVVDATGELLAQPRTSFQLANGSKVGVFALTTPETITAANPLLVRGLTFLAGEELYACAQEQVDALRKEGCDLVVCLAHLGESEVLAPSRACDVAENVSGIDLMLDGHDHEEESQVLKSPEGGDVLVVEKGCYTHAVGVVTWEGDVLADTLVAFGSYEGQDAAVDEVVRAEAEEVGTALSVPVATCDFALDGERDPGVRTRETNFGDLIADAMLWEARQMSDDYPDAAIANGGSIRQSLEAGEMTRGDVLDVMPFTNYLCTVRVTGAQLLEAIEAACSASPEELGAFPQVSGITYTVDTTKPYEEGPIYPGSTYAKPANPGSRVTIQDVGGKGFSLDAEYVIASSDFVCVGGDTYYCFAEAAQTTLKSTNYLVSDALRYYLEEELGGVVPERYKEPEGRISIIVA